MCMTKISRKLILPLCAVFFFIGALTVQAATYFVATTGNDSNPGTSGSPWRNPQRCTSSPVTAGDTCTVADGTYTDTNGNGIVVYASGSSVQGRAGAPITIKSTNPLGAVIALPGIPSLNAGFYIGANYYVIDGFDISGGTSTSLSASHHGIYIGNGTIGTVVRNNAIHHIGRNLCYESDFGNTGVFTEGSTTLIEQNTLYSIGRRKPGESGCSTTHTQHDHGMYIKNGSGLTVQRNVIYDTNRGWAMHFYGGSVTNANVFNNTFSDHNTTTSIAGHIMLASILTNVNIKNNISHDATIGMVQYYSLTATNVLVDHNLSSNAMNTGTRAGVTFTNNLTSTSPGFVKPSENDYHLATGSAAINAGTIVGIVGLLVNGAAPDIGAYEFANQGGDTIPPLAPVSLHVQ